MRIGAHEFEEVLQRSFKTDLVHDAAHFVVDAGDFRQAKLVDLFGGDIHRRIAIEEVIIIFTAIGMFPDPVIAGGAFGLFLEQGNDPAIGRGHDVAQGR